MPLPVLNEQQRNMLQAVLHTGSIAPDELSQLCKNAFGWSAAVIRRTQKSLLAQRVLREENGLLIPTISNEDLENQLWDSRLQDTFEWQSPAMPENEKKQPFFKSIWFWTTCVACVVIAVLCALLVFPPAPETSIPEELQICKEALDKWQENESYHILIFTEIISSEHSTQLPNPFTSFYAHEDDWMLLCWDPQNLNASTFPNYLYRDNQLYISYNAVTPQWQSADMSTTTPKLWPMVFSWENCELDYWDTTSGNNEQYINFRIIDHSFETAVVYEIKFVLDDAQNLTTIEVITIQSDRTIRKDTYNLSDTTPEEIAQLISDAEIVTPDIGINEPFIEPG